MRLSTMLRHPTGYVPLALSGIAVLTIVVHVVVAGTAPQADEGTAAHIWQLVMVLQLPALAVFAIRWLPEAPRQALAVLGLQLAAIGVAVAPVLIFKW